MDRSYSLTKHSKHPDFGSLLFSPTSFYGYAPEELCYTI